MLYQAHMLAQALGLYVSFTQGCLFRISIKITQIAMLEQILMHCSD